MIKKVLIATGTVAAVLIVIYIGIGIFYQSHFFPNSTVNGVDSSSATLDTVKQRITDQTAAYEINVIEKQGGLSTLHADEVGLTVDTGTGAIDALLDGQNGFAWIKALFENTDYVSESLVSVDKNKLGEAVSGLPCMLSSHMTKTEDATIKFDGSRFIIVDEVYGTELRKNDLVDYLYDAIVSLRSDVDLFEEGVYVQPKVLSDDEELNARVEKLNKGLDMTLTYEVGETVEASLIEKWISINDSGDIEYDEEAIAEYVEGLAQKYDTVGTTRSFAMSGGGTVTVSGGDYGWKMDTAGETEQLIEDLKRGEDVSRDFVYEYTAESHGDNDYGNSYIEVDISRQHAWLYVDGGLVTDTDCVTGNLKRNLGTHLGAYRIDYKQANRVLKGGEEAVEVKYWMPFNGGEGLHDAWWKSSFGGNQYITDGSHGCVNLPSSQAKIFFENVEAGFPVIIYASAGGYSAEPNPNAVHINSIIEVLKDLSGVNQDNYIQIINMMNLYNSLPPDDQAQVVYKKRFFNAYNTALQYAATYGMPETPAAETGETAAIEGGATGEVVTEQSAAEQPPEEGTM